MNPDYRKLFDALKAAKPFHLTLPSGISAEQAAEHVEGLRGKRGITTSRAAEGVREFYSALNRATTITRSKTPTNPAAISAQLTEARLLQSVILKYADDLGFSTTTGTPVELSIRIAELNRLNQHVQKEAAKIEVKVEQEVVKAQEKREDLVRNPKFSITALNQQISEITKSLSVEKNAARKVALRRELSVARAALDRLEGLKVSGEAAEVRLKNLKSELRQLQADAKRPYWNPNSAARMSVVETEINACEDTIARYAAIAEHDEPPVTVEKVEAVEASDTNAPSVKFTVETYWKSGWVEKALRGEFDKIASLNDQLKKTSPQLLGRYKQVGGKHVTLAEQINNTIAAAKAEVIRLACGRFTHDERAARTGVLRGQLRNLQPSRLDTPATAKEKEAKRQAIVAEINFLNPGYTDRH